MCIHKITTTSGALKKWISTTSSPTEKQAKTNSMYTLILVPQDSVTHSKVSTELYGEGEITVAGSSSTTAVAGEKVEINITAVTANVPQALNTDENGNCLVGNYSDLQQMAKMVNSGYKKYAKGSYVVTNSFDVCDNGFLWTTPIGTEDSPFSGSFDGQGYVINQFVQDPYSTENNFGLFGIVDEGTIENLNLVMNTNTASECHYSLGTICGYNIDSEIVNCTSDNEMLILPL